MPPRVGQGHYRARRRVRQVKIGACRLALESRREVVRQAWTKLDQRQAHIIHRWYVEGWSVDEIAAETRLAVGHIYVLKHRGLKKLREYCAEE